MILQDGSELLEGKDDDQNLLMTIDQSGYPPQFSVEQLQFISQLQVSKRVCIIVTPSITFHFYSNNTNRFCKLIRTQLPKTS